MNSFHICHLFIKILPLDLNMSNYYIGVDVGTGSVRAALVQYNGDIIKTSICPIKIWNPQKDFYEQSSNDIWKSCCKVVKVNKLKVYKFIISFRIFLDIAFV